MELTLMGLTSVPAGGVPLVLQGVLLVTGWDRWRDPRRDPATLRDG
jgi:hypothetical protein